LSTSAVRCVCTQLLVISIKVQVQDAKHRTLWRQLSSLGASDAHHGAELQTVQ
jgi:hypothetical protein